MRKIISLVDIINCNASLKDQNLNFKIHLRDACGKQSCWIEPLEDGQGTYDMLYPVLEEFFQSLGFQLEYSDDKINFWLNQG